MNLFGFLRTVCAIQIISIYKQPQKRQERPRTAEIFRVKNILLIRVFFIADVQSVDKFNTSNYEEVFLSFHCCTISKK